MSNEVWKTGALSWSAINAGTASIDNTDVIADGIIIYVEGIVNTSQKNVNYKVGVGGTTQFQNLPYKLPVYIEISADTDLTSAGLGVNGNVLVIRNTEATAKTITYAAGIARSIPAGLTATMKYLGGWTDLINASGVRFPTTQIPSSDPNTLDDYEEGLFDSGLSFGGASTGITYSYNSGYYTINGNRVTVNGFIALTSKGSSTGDALITGLPVVSSGVGSNYSVANLKLSGVTFADVYQGFILTSSNAITLREITSSTGAETTLTDVNFANTSNLIFELTYSI